MVTKQHESHMRWALALALEGMGHTSPNPMVGAVIVKGNRIIGEGYHLMAGTPHAEVNALRKAGREARGADLYVTLEPCCHEGRTPPCVGAIVKAGIKRVFIGTRDPNPFVCGRGIRALRRAGIKVIEGVMEESCRGINETYNKYVVTGVPFITAKVALSLDGKLATASGESKWITNRQCREYIHGLRARVDAVMVGGGTVRKDNPRLNVRLKGWRGKDPLAVIVDEKLNIPGNSRFLKRRPRKVIVATTGFAPESRRRWIERMGHKVMVCHANRSGTVSLTHMLRGLGKEGITSVLLEGGGELFTDFFERGLVDRVVICTAPKLIGGRGKDFLPGFETRCMRDAQIVRDVSVKTFGDNVVVEGRLK